MPTDFGVAIDTGGVSRTNAADERIFRAAAQMVRQQLIDAGAGGRFMLRPVTKTRQKGGSGIRLKFPHRSRIRIQVRPGDNDSAWEYDLVVPQGTNTERLFDDLRRLDEPTHVLDQVRPHAESNGHSESNGTAGDQFDLVKRLQELQQAEERIQSRSKRIGELETKRSKLREELKRVDDELMKLMEEEESDTEAQEARQVLGALRKVFAK